MTKVIKGEFDKIKDVKVEDVSLAYTPLEVFKNVVSRSSGMDDDLFTYEVEVANIPCDSKMDDDLFTYEVEVANIPCDSKMDDDSEHEADDDMGYDPEDDKIELTDEECFDDMDEVAEVFRIDTN
ncbi:hypothetical protein Tco_0739418 [Tanacetum coccineum]